LQSEPPHHDTTTVPSNRWQMENTSPETVYSNLKKQSDYYNFHKRTAAMFVCCSTTGLYARVA
jgi:hypothetical protein